MMTKLVNLQQREIPVEELFGHHAMLRGKDGNVWSVGRIYEVEERDGRSFLHVDDTYWFFDWTFFNEKINRPQSIAYPYDTSSMREVTLIMDYGITMTYSLEGSKMTLKRAG